MEPVVISCTGCVARIRVRRPDSLVERRCPRCGTVLPAIPQGTVHVEKTQLAGDRRPRRGIAVSRASFPLIGARWQRRARVLTLTITAVLLSANAICHTLGPSLDTHVGLGGPGTLDLTRSGPGTAGAPLPVQPASAIRERGLLTSLTPEPTPVQTTVRAQLLPFSIGPISNEPPIPPRPAVLPDPTGDDSGRVPLRERPPTITSPKPPLPPRPEARHQSEPTAPAIPSASPSGRPEEPSLDRPEPKRLLVRMRNGRTVVARVHGGTGPRTHVMLPDGQLGVPDSLAYTTAPFQPATADEVAAELTSGLFAGFGVERTAHYVILHRSSQAFARASGEVLESLYKGLTEAFRKRDFPVTEAEFPLVAVIFKTEGEFREFRAVDENVRAYYEIDTNRIYFYETSEGDAEPPELSAVRRPQTVAHEGTHQILQNIGIHPRLAEWPPWLVEGLAEYCATPSTTKRGTTWTGLGVANAQHLATIRDLADPPSAQVPGTERPEHIGRPVGMPLVEYLVQKTKLTPTDYALSWAMTHYLAMKRVDAFVGYLKTMSQMPPLEERSPEEHLNAFRDAFGDNLGKLDREIGVYLSKMKTKDVLPYYAVLFQQRVPGAIYKRAIVSQSPSMIQQWLETVTSPQGEPPVWEPVKHANRTRAWVTAQQWVRGY
ncbi:MAG: DUF1570 domain-containing protein [Isosphaeraceae bacterium]